MPNTIKAIYEQKFDNRLIIINDISSQFKHPIYQSMFLGLTMLLSDDIIKVLHKETFKMLALNDIDKIIFIMKFIDKRVVK